MSSINSRRRLIRISGQVSPKRPIRIHWFQRTSFKTDSPRITPVPIVGKPTNWRRMMRHVRVVADSMAQRGSHVGIINGAGQIPTMAVS